MTKEKNPFEYHDSDLYVACVGDNGGTDDFDIREGFKTSVNILIDAVQLSNSSKNETDETNQKLTEAEEEIVIVIKNSRIFLSHTR